MRIPEIAPNRGHCEITNRTDGENAQYARLVPQMISAAATLIGYLQRRPGILAIARIAALTLIVIPTAAVPAQYPLDSSWMIGINLAHVNHLVFGRDVIFTYGPLGFLLEPTFPEADPWLAFAFYWTIAAVSAYALWQTCRNAGHWTATFLYLGVFWISGAVLFDSSAERLFGATLALSLAIVVRFDEGPWIEPILLSLLSAVALLAKLNLGILVTSVAWYLSAWFAWRSRAIAPPWKRIVILFSVWVGAFVGFYGISNGTPAGIPDYLRNSAEIVEGYSEAMSIAGSDLVPLTALLTFLALISLPLLCGSNRRMLPAIPILAVIAFLCFKSAVVREDGHHAIPFQFEMAMAALLVPALASSSRSRLVTGAFATACLAAGIAVINQRFPFEQPRCLNRLSGFTAVQNLGGFLRWTSTVEIIEARTDDIVSPQSLPLDFAVLLQGKRLASYPWDIDLIRANQLLWQPVPVLQAYSAYTPSLDLINAVALERPGGPEVVLLAGQPVDDRYPFYDTPRSWQALVDWYDLYRFTPGLLALRRRASPRFEGAVPAGETIAKMGADIRLPAVADNEILIMDADIPESLAGKIRHLVFRANFIEIQAVRESGTVVRGRVVRANLRDGVIVSDCPNPGDDFVPLFRPSAAPFRDRVVSIRFDTVGPTEYQSDICIRWARRRLHVSP